MKISRIVLWIAVACLGATGLVILATARGEDRPNVLWFIVAAVCVYAFAYRFYSRFIASRVLELDDRNITPAVRLNNGRDYVPTDHEYFKLSDDELADRFTGALKAFNPAFTPEWIRKRWVFRAPYAQPIPFVNHSRNIPDLRTPIPGLYLASMSQVYPWDRGTNFAVEIGRRVAKMVMEDEK